MSLTPTQLADALSAAVIAYVGDSDGAALQASLREIWTGNGLATEDLAMGVSELVANVKGWMRFGPVSTLTAAGTVDLGSAATHLVTISGDASITSFGDSATVDNPIFEVKLTGSPLLVHSADLVLPGAENIQGGPGDAFMVEALGEGAFKVWFYFRSDGEIVNSAIAASLEEAVAAVQEEGAAQVEAVGAAALAAIGGLPFDTVPAEEGFDGGWAVTDPNGWTTDENYFRQAGIVGPVHRTKVPGVDWSGVSGAFQIAVLPRMPSSFSIYLNASDSLVNGAVLPNRLAVDPANIDENILLYDTGFMKQQGAGSQPIHGLDGEWVTWRASSPTDFFNIWNADLPPAGALGIAFEVRAEPGFGTQSIKYGNSSFLQSLSVPDTPSPPRTEFDFTPTGSGSNYNNFGFRGDGTSTPRIQIRRIILMATGGVGQPANAAALPAWASLKRGSGDARKEVAWPNGLPKSGNFLDNTGNLARVAIRDPDHTTGNDYRNVGVSGVTLIVACQLDTGGTGSSAIGVDVNAVKGTGTTSLGIGTSSSSIVSHNPGTIGVGVSGWLRAAIEDEGIHFLCIRVENGQQIASFHEIDFNWDTDAFAMEANVWRLGGQTSAATWKGKIRAAAIAFDFVSEDDKVACMAKLAYDIANEGDTVADFDFAEVFGDSRLANAISGGTRVIDAISADGHYGADPNLFTYQFATGGETLATLASTDLARMVTMAGQMTLRGRKGIVTGMLGTNDANTLIADPNAYLASQISTIWDALDAVDGSENLYFAPFNEIVRYQSGWNTQIAVYEAAMDAQTGRNSDPSKAFNDVVDSQSTLVGLSNLSAIAANPSTWFQENPNYIHPNATGNASLPAPVDAMVGRYRTWKAS